MEEEMIAMKKLIPVIKSKILKDIVDDETHDSTSKNAQLELMNTTSKGYQMKVYLPN